jgi:hypothetical protein
MFHRIALLYACLHCLQAVPCVHTNLQSLTGLSKLQSLVIWAPQAYADYWEQPYYFFGDEDKDEVELHAVHQFPGPLTSLTKLCLPLEVMPILGSFSKCVRLQDLHLLSIHGVPKLSPVAWTAMAQLTNMTRLHVDMNFTLEEEPEAELCYGVLRRLKRLREVGAFIWLPSFLPLLQTLTQLTSVHGCWFLDNSIEDMRGLACSHVRDLGNAMHIPTAAFPNLECVSFEVLSPQELVGLSRAFPKLQKLVLLDTHNFPVVGGVDGSAERLAAFASLAHLQHATHLDLAPACDAELVAFTSAAAAVSTPHLRRLHVRGPLTLFALMQLPSVRGLRELLVHVTSRQDKSDTFTLEAVRLWLVGLAVVPKVYLLLRSAEQRGVFDAAIRWAVEIGLPLPAVLKVSVV